MLEDLIERLREARINTLRVLDNLEKKNNGEDVNVTDINETVVKRTNQLKPTGYFSNKKDTESSEEEALKKIEEIFNRIM